MKKLLIFFLIFGIFACKKESNLRARCYVRFLEEEQKLESKVELRTLTQKEAAAIAVDEVRMNDNLMDNRENLVTGNYYAQERHDGYPTKGFDFLIKKEDIRCNINFDVAPIANCRIEGGKMSKSKGFTVAWDGKNLLKGEDVTITITDKMGITAQAVINGATQKSGAFIPAEMYSGLAQGEATVFLVKTSLPVAKVENIVAEAEVGYYSKPFTVEIID